MAKWISIERAAIKYRINKEVLMRWGKNNYLPLRQIEDATFVDEEHIDEFMRQDEERFKRELIDTLEELCIVKTQICQSKNEMLEIKDEMIQLLSREIDTLKEIQKSMNAQDIRVQDFMKDFAAYKSSHNEISRIKRLCMKMKRIIHKLYNKSN